MEILTAYVQSNAPWPPTQRGQGQPEENPELEKLKRLGTWAPDVQAAMTVLGRRDRRDESLKLADVDLRRARLNGREMNFEGAHFGRGCFRRADFREARLARAQFGNSLLGGADLRGADLRGAVLTGAEFFAKYDKGSKRARTDLRGACLDGAHLDKVDERGKIISKANLEGILHNTATTWPKDFDPTDHGAPPPDEAGEPDSVPPPD